MKAQMSKMGTVALPWSSRSILAVLARVNRAVATLAVPFPAIEPLPRAKNNSVVR
jgi:hypothetical protein